MKLKILFVSTSVGPLGSGLGGGVELTLTNLAQALTQRGHQITTIAPQASTDPSLHLITVPGALQGTAQTQGRDAAIALSPHPTQGSVLGNMWEKARQIQADYDLILNFAYDWLPFYLTPFFDRPIAHLVSMGSLSDAMDQIIAQTVEHFPGTIGVHSRAQAETFAFADHCRVLYNGFDLSQYRYQPEAQPEAQPSLAWVGRIAPEKGLEDAVAAIALLQRQCNKYQHPPSAPPPQTLKIWGAMQDEAYWLQIQQQFPNAPVEYCGFLDTPQLQAQLGACQGLVMTPKWIEAFGNVAIEALACGVPVVAYARGGPAEIVQEGETGWLVEPDSVAGLAEAIAKLPRIDRARCRQAAEARYSLAAMGDRVEQWLTAMLQP